MTKKRITTDTLGEALVEAVPELRAEYDENKSFYSEEAFKDHLVYGMALNPSLMEWLELEDNPELLTRVFSFIEELASSDDRKVRNVVTVTVCERIDSNEKALQVAHKYMGPNTRKLADEIAEYWSTG